MRAAKERCKAWLTHMFLANKRLPVAPNKAHIPPRHKLPPNIVDPFPKDTSPIAQVTFAAVLGQLSQREAGGYVQCTELM